MKTAIICGIFGVLFLIPTSPANAFGGFGNCQCVGRPFFIGGAWHCDGRLSCPNRKVCGPPHKHPPPPAPRGHPFRQPPTTPADPPRRHSDITDTCGKALDWLVIEEAAR